MKPNSKQARRGRQITVAGCLAFALAVSTSCHSKPDSTDGGAKSQAEDHTVAVTKVARGDISKTVMLTAEFFPWQQVEIHAKVSGYVEKMNVDVGDHAKTGDVLAVLEIPELDQELNQAKASVLMAQQDEKSIEAELNETTLIASRINAAAKQTLGLIAQQDVDNANDTNRSNQAKLDAAKQKITEAQANQARLQAMVNYAQVTAPFDGVVTRRYADTGSLVQAGTVQSGTGSNSDSMPIVSFAQLDMLRLEFPVPEPDVTSVHVGDVVEVDVLSMDKHFEGKVARLAQKVDMSTRTMLTEVDVPNPDFAYEPGMYATVKLSLAQQKNVLTIPVQSLSSGDTTTVLTVVDDKIHRQPVTVGLETPDRVEILNGVNEGDLVVVGNRSALQEGETVSPQFVSNQYQ